jgi:hypothetical protein
MILPQISGHFSDFRIELDISVLLLAPQNGILQVEMQKDKHLIVTGLEERMLDVVVEDIDFISTQCNITETINVSFQLTHNTLGDDVRTDIDFLELWISLVGAQDQFVLLNCAFLFALFGFGGTITLLQLFDETIGGL